MTAGSGRIASKVLASELCDLGEVVDPTLAGILVPRGELGEQKVGLSEQFVSNAATYAERYSAVPYFRHLIVEATRGRFATAPAVVLDIGSGSGNSVLPCLELFPQAEVVATDLSESMLAILRDHVAMDAAASARLALVCVDATRADFKEHSVDLAVGAAILHHLIDPVACIRRLCRALRPGGIAIFFEPFEAGYAMLKLAYQEILDVDGHDSCSEHLELAAANLLRALLVDWRVRTGEDKSSSLFREIDDKWLFTRSYFERIAAEVGSLSLTIVPLNVVAEPFSLETETLFRVALGVAPENTPRALPEWAWEIMRKYDRAFSAELKRDLPLAACITFKRVSA